MSRLVVAELRKLRHQGLTWIVLAGLLVLFPALWASDLLYANEWAGGPGRVAAAVAGLQAQSVGPLVGIVVLVAGTRLIGMEYAQGTVRVLLARGVGRLRLLAAKLVALQLAGLAAVGIVAAFGCAAVVVAELAWGAGPGGVGAALGLALGAGSLSGLVSVTACTLLAAAAAGLGRSEGFAIGAALTFFPADNLVGGGLHQVALLARLPLADQLGGCLLGPNLNHLPGQLTGLPSVLLDDPLTVDLGHVLAVAAAWSVGFLALAIFMTHRRDTLE